VLGLSIALQIAAAGVALFNVRRTGAFLAWILVAAAILLMAVRRITSFVHIMAGWNDLPPSLNLVPELIALLISILMLTGLLLLGPMFRFLKRLADERQMLLHESLHSTKNNLQSLLSLFQVQEAFLATEREQSVAQEMERRVRVFVMLQEELFRSHADLDCRAFITALVNSVVESYERPKNPVDLEVRLEKLDVSDRQLLYCGLVVNEALTNAFKYAVPLAEAPRIEVSSGRSGGKNYLQIRDNGPGFPERTSQATQSGFGLTFLESLNGDNGWTVDLHNEDGAVVTFYF
jgi:two-component sensor histidine kinase